MNKMQTEPIFLSSSNSLYQLDQETLSFLITMTMNLTAFSIVIGTFGWLRKYRNDKLLTKFKKSKEQSSDIDKKSFISRNDFEV